MTRPVRPTTRAAAGASSAATSARDEGLHRHDCLAVAAAGSPRAGPGLGATPARCPCRVGQGSILQGSMESAMLTRQKPGPSRPTRPLPLERLRAVPSGTWARIGFAAMCVGAVIGYFAFPTYPTYDSFYALLWGRDVLHLHLPDFHVYRAPTEHPLAIAFGVLCSLFGQGGARLMVLGSIASFVAAVGLLYRLGRLCFGPVVGLVAALLLLSRFFLENLAAQGYLDISYIALIIWAVTLEVQRPRRGAAVLAVLAAAGLL